MINQTSVHTYVHTSLGKLTIIHTYLHTHTLTYIHMYIPDTMYTDTHTYKHIHTQHTQGSTINSCLLSPHVIKRISPIKRMCKLVS